VINYKIEALEAKLYELCCRLYEKELKRHLHGLGTVFQWLSGNSQCVRM